MNELVNMIAKKTNLSPEMSRTVVTMVLDFVKKKLPAPVTSQIDTVLGNSSAAEGVVGTISGLFGKK